MRLTLTDSNDCFYCEATLEKPRNNGRYKAIRSVDHLLPRSKGGSNKSENLVDSCLWCNHERDDKSFVHFFTKVQKLKEEVKKQGSCLCCLRSLKFKKVRRYKDFFICGECGDLLNDRMGLSFVELLTIKQGRVHEALVR